MEAYKKVGRGGAGNFYSKKDIEDVSKAATADIEAQDAPTEALAHAISASKPLPEYQHAGRGGAGNWFQPKELKDQGLAQEGSENPTSTAAETTSSIGLSKRVLGGSKPTYRGGRGGAGNYVDFEAEERARKDEEEKLRVEMERNVERDVEAGLSKPPKAYGGIGGAWEMNDMK